jgi:hypothetical protein
MDIGQERVLILPAGKQIDELCLGQELFIFILELSVLQSKGLVPDKTAAPGKLLETLFFSIPELESEFIALANQHDLYYIAYTKKTQEKIQSPYIPYLKEGVLRRSLIKARGGRA